MSQISISKFNSGGFDGSLLNNGIIELNILPELGGKIGSLRDLRTGREWLWRHPRLPYKKVPHGSSYTAEADTGGWDECFPSVSECSYPSVPWKGALIQDHGELWNQLPVLELEEKKNEVKLAASWHGVNIPYIFRRIVTVKEDSAIISAEYEVENTSDEQVNFVWCIHTLLAIEPGMELRLPASAQFNVPGAYPEGLVPLDKKLSYPFAASGLNFPFLPETNAGRAIKLWSDPLSDGEGWAAVRAKDGEFRMRWDVSLLPQVAVWMNFGAFGMDGGSPYFNMGLEPCIGAQDSLNDAVNIYNLYAALPPHEKKTWHLEIELTA